jgi:hypothetical protein
MAVGIGQKGMKAHNCEFSVRNASNLVERDPANDPKQLVQ